ncbi:MAG TPA: MarR family winged helix-turn-helix transcriptional regulator [Conexibacter sp.]|nr:MarR family winged helix-turn-helix transcriptional regulator [Conexibacter sp.]
MSGRPPLGDADYARLLEFRIELRRFLRHSEAAAHYADLTPALHQLLLAVRGAAPALDRTIGELAAALDVRHHTAVELAQRAEQLRLVIRYRDEHDHRQVHVRLTAAGRHRLDRVTRSHLPAIRELADRLVQVAAAGDA